MGWHCPKSLLFIETECSFNIKETWSEFRWGPRLDLKHICPPVQCKTTFKHQASVNQLFLVQRTVQTTNLPFATGLFKKYTTITKFVEKKQYVTTFPGSQHHQNKNGEKFWVSLGPHGFPTQRTFKVGKSTTTLATFHDFKSFKGGRCFFWATKLHYCCYMFPVKFSCLGGVKKKIQCSGIWRKTA